MNGLTDRNQRTVPPMAQEMSRPSSGASGPKDFAAIPAAAVVANKDAATVTHHQDCSPGKIVVRRAGEESMVQS